MTWPTSTTTTAKQIPNRGRQLICSPIRSLRVILARIWKIKVSRRVVATSPDTRRWLIGSFAGWGTIVLSLLGVGLLVILGSWIRNISTRYELTKERLIINRGLFVRTEDEIELFRVKDVRVSYSLLNQMAGIGTVSLTSSDQTTRGGPLVMQSIPQARSFRETLRRLVNEERARRGVHELDTDIL
jgi:uncharacterized membrane protein YdbT with pleckstrin-like domain